MDVIIRFEERDGVNVEDSCNLQELAELIREECDPSSLTIECQEERSGIKDGGLSTGIAIVSLVFTVLQTLISALQFWESQHSKYDLFLMIDDGVTQRKLLLRNCSNIDIERIFSRLRLDANYNNNRIEFHITKK